MVLISEPNADVIVRIAGQNEVDSEAGIVHRVSTTIANVQDVAATHNLLHGDDRVV